MSQGIRKCLTLAAVFLAAWLGLRLLLPLAGPFILGAVLALLSEPAVSFLCRRLRLPRSPAVFIGVTMTFFLLALVLLTLLALLFRELGMLAGILPDLEETARAGMNLLMNWLLGLTSRTPEGIRSLLERSITQLFSGGSVLLDRGIRYILGLAGGLLSGIPDSALTLGTGSLAAYMISAKLPAIRQWLLLRLQGSFAQSLLTAGKQIKTAVGRYLKAQLKLSGITLVILTLGFVILRIPYAPLWAVVVSLVDAFPVLGTGTILLPWSLVSILQGNPARALGLAGVYAVVCLTRTTLEPRLVGKQLGLDPLVTLMALYAGYRLWGIGGMIFSPVLAVSTVQLLSASDAANPAQEPGS